MLLALIAGMWMILAFGSTLEAPHDLAGEWELLPEGRGDGASLRCDPSPSRDIYRVTLATPQLEQRRYSGRITKRSYPRAPAANKPQDVEPAPAKSNVGIMGTPPTTHPATHAH